MKNAHRFFSVLLAFAVLLVASTVPAAEVLDNNSIIELQKLNMGDDVIIEKIRTSTCSFDTSMGGLKALKTAGVSSPVIAAMIAAKSTVSTGSTAVGNSNDPKSPHAAGLWAMDGKKMVQITAETPSEISHGGFIGPWGIGKVATTARLSGMESKLQLSQDKPEFYLYLNASGMELAGAATPAEVTLAQLTVLGKEDKHNPDQRALDVAVHGAYGSSYGVDRKAVHTLEISAISDEIYKLVPKEALTNGEYALCVGANNAAMTGQYKYFTFGVHTK